jgi:hemolysin III
MVATPTGVITASPPRRLPPTWELPLSIDPSLHPAAIPPAAGVPEVRVKPRLRGVFHQYAFLVSLGAGALLVLLAATTRATVAVAVYAASVSGLFGVSALYHRVTWTPPARRRMRRLDHAMIFLLIAGTYTPVSLLVLKGTLATIVLVVVWTGAIAGIVLELGWTGAPRWLGGAVYLALGWVAVVAMPQLFARLGLAGGLLLTAGGLVYTAGALVYALRRPDPVPAVFGYHEIFHLLVIIGVAAHFLAISLFAVPTG